MSWESGSASRSMSARTVSWPWPALPSADTLRKSVDIAGTVDISDPLPSYRFWLKDTPFEITETPPFTTITFSGIPEGRHVLLSMITNTNENISGIIRSDTINCIPELTFTISGLTPSILGAGGDTFLLDDFEDGDYRNTLGQKWWTFNEANVTRDSSVSVVTWDSVPQAPGADGSSYCFGMSYTFKDVGEFVGFGVWFSATGTIYRRCFDMSAVKRIEFRIKGTPDNCSVGFNTGISAQSARIATIDTLPAEWKLYSIDMNELFAQDISTAIRLIDKMRYATGLVIVVSNNDDTAEGEIRLDDIRFIF